MSEQRRELPKEKCPRCGESNIVVENPDVLGEGRQWMKCSKCKWLISRYSEGGCWTVVIDTPYPKHRKSEHIGIYKDRRIDGL